MGLVEQYEREKYRELWSTLSYRGPSAISYGNYLAERIHGTCIDLGCGDCTTMNILKNLDIWGIDIVTDQCLPGFRVVEGVLWDMPFMDKFFDFSFSTDVLEHIPTEYVRDVIEEIGRITKVKTFHYISTKPAVTTYKGEQVHLTVKPPEWWEEMFMLSGIDHELKFW